MAGGRVSGPGAESRFAHGGDEQAPITVALCHWKVAVKSLGHVATLHDKSMGCAETIVEGRVAVGDRLRLCRVHERRRLKKGPLSSHFHMSGRCLPLAGALCSPLSLPSFLAGQKVQFKGQKVHCTATGQCERLIILTINTTNQPRHMTRHAMKNTKLKLLIGALCGAFALVTASLPAQTLPVTAGLQLWRIERLALPLFAGLTTKTMEDRSCG